MRTKCITTQQLFQKLSHNHLGNLVLNILPDPQLSNVVGVRAESLANPHSVDMGTWGTARTATLAHRAGRRRHDHGPILQHVYVRTRGLATVAQEARHRSKRGLDLLVGALGSSRTQLRLPARPTESHHLLSSVCHHASRSPGALHVALIRGAWSTE